MIPMYEADPDNWEPDPAGKSYDGRMIDRSGTPRIDAPVPPYRADTVYVTAETGSGPIAAFSNLEDAVTSFEEPEQTYRGWKPRGGGDQWRPTFDNNYRLRSEDGSVYITPMKIVP